PSGQPERSVGSVFDFTDQMQAQNEVLFLSTHDPLTGLLNRHQLLEVLDHYSSGERSGALVLFDVDRFAQINEIAGHAVGDQLLRAIADRMRFLEADGHYVARLGSDEFACLLVDPKDREVVDEGVDRLRDVLDAPFEAGHAEFVLRATMGLALHPKDGTGEQLLQNAGMALHAAKTAARGGLVRYGPALERKMSVRSRLQRDLPTAIERSEFAMYYQPLIDAESDAVIAAEALLRWQHPELGLLTPDVFLAIAEESDAVVEIGRWAIDRACHDAMLIRDSLGRDVRLNVNVSPRHVQSSKLVGHVWSALTQSGWLPANLQLEVTEQLLIEDIPSAVSTLEQLRDRGISIAIDDFGTGYNTLSYLKSYPVSCLKIDRAFVKDAEIDRYSRAICRSVAALADSLHMNVIGEGVETVGQADFLRTIGCRELQGFHFGHPVAAWDFMTTYGSEGVWLT
ncbi:MAG TPA: bifunctional diguanylate cyclase/phosphodiesterase, partial [Candidatus Aquilonibacter sp.]